MKRVCAWCKKDIGISPSAGMDENIITHGICEECKKAFFLEIGEELIVF